MVGKKCYPFTAIVGQEQMKTALILNVINPKLGGVLIRGEKGTAKSTAVRALAEVLPDTRVVDLPVSATEDRVVGTLDIEHALMHGEKKFEPGILAQADKNILYVDEVNLLDDHIVDILLDSAAMGINTVEREGISYSHPARFTLVGTMNPEEGDLRPQLLDRFGLVVEVTGEEDTKKRVEVIRRRLAFEENPDEFISQYKEAQNALTQQILQARERLADVTFQDDILEAAARISIRLGVDGHRADIGMIKTAVTFAAWEGRLEAEKKDLLRAANFVLPHRLRRKPFEEKTADRQSLAAIIQECLEDEKND